MKEFLSKKKKLIIEILIAILVLLVTAGISLLILIATKVVSFDGGIVFNAKLFDSFKNSWYGWLIFIAFQSALTILLCIVPGVSMAFIILCTTLYSSPGQAFLISFISVMISSMVMYLIGRFGGYKLCVKILGKEECEKTLPLLSSKSTVYFPLMMVFPVFPDDALIMLAGTMKMKLRWFIPSIVIGRSIGILTIVFGMTIVPFEEFDSLYDWLVFGTVCIVWLSIIFHLANKLNQKIEEKKHHKEEKEKIIEMVENNDVEKDLN